MRLRCGEGGENKRVQAGDATGDRFDARSRSITDASAPVVLATLGCFPSVGFVNLRDMLKGVGGGGE